MGSWGYDAWDSDAAMDWLVVVEKHTFSVIEKTLRSFLKAKPRKIKMRKLVISNKRSKGAIVVRRGPGASVRAWAVWEVIGSAPGRRYGHEEAEAAAKLLDELTPYSKSYYILSSGKRRIGRRMFSSVRRKFVTAKTPGAKQRVGEGGTRLRLNFDAERGKMYSLAVRVLEEILKDRPFIENWREPEEKRRELAALIASLSSKRRNEVTPEEMAQAMRRRKRRRA